MKAQTLSNRGNTYMFWEINLRNKLKTIQIY